MNKRTPIFVLSFFIFLTAILSGCGEKSILNDNITKDNSQLTVSFIDVGQGDSTLINCNGALMLIDAGTYADRYSVINYLSAMNIDYLDYIVATHPHSDHIGGMAEVIYSFDCGTLIYPEVEDASSSWNFVLDAADEKGLIYDVPKVGDTYNLGGAEITVLSPDKGNIYSNLNDYSLVLKLKYEDVSFLFTGDAEKVVEKSLVNSGFDLESDVLKAGHHGSSTSSCEEFIKEVNPEVAVISCGKDNDYGHPHDETLETFAKYNVQVYRTDLSSTIIAYSDGESITFENFDGELKTTAYTETTITYVGNSNSKVFHQSDCASVDTMKDSNKVYFENRQEAVDNGYKPCGACNP